MNKGIIIHRKRRDEEIVETIKKSESPIYIYGCGDSGTALYDYLNAMKIYIDAFIIDDEFFSCDKYREVPVKKLSEVNNSGVKINVLIGFANYHIGLDKLKNVKNINNIFCISNPYQYLFKQDLDLEFYNKYEAEFDNSYRLLKDNLSKSIMTAYLNTRINRDYEFLMPYSGSKTYFNNDIITLTDNESYVDCGAYNGDSVEKFIKSVNGNYYKIFAIEPDIKNFNELKQNISGENICLVNRGVWCEDAELGFVNEGQQEFSINRETGETQKNIRVSTLDNIIGEERVTLLKLSVQGAEVEAILGAQKILKKWEPAIAITIFMKPDALIKIPHAIKKINSRYQFYLRCEEPFFARVILYAVTKEE